MKELSENVKAIDVVRQMVADGQVSKDVAEKYFPELKDSEDETIRKVLIQYFSTFRLGTFAGLEPKKIIAWLEKQGTPAKLSEEEQNRFAKGILTSCAMSFIDYLDAHKYEGKMCVSNGECEDIENAFHNAMWDKLHRYYGKYIEKQGEKNPYKEDFGDLLMDVKFGIVPSQKQDEQILANSAKTCKDEQKSWSEVDNFMYNKIKNLLTDISLAPESINSLFDWLKDLKDRIQPQPKQEWSEEDEKYVKDLADYFTGGLSLKHAEEDIADWFKSLKDRYAWKPSEEMLEALDIAIRAGIQLGSWEEKALRELQKQLKAL